MSISNLLVLGLFILITLCGVIWLVRRARRVAAPKTHVPHKPGPGYDSAEMARSKEAGSGYNR